MHTHASDGNASISEMALAARQRGLKYIAITDHSQSLTVAHGLDEERLQAQIDEIDRLNEDLSGIMILKGSEVDILEDGRLNLTDNYCQLAKEQGVLLSINSDGHSVNNFDFLKGGINQSRRGWLEKTDVLNTRALRELRKMLTHTMV